jgi:phenylalanine-4-hydroxylase
MQQNYAVYTPEDFEVWKLLFERQHLNLQEKVCSDYLECLQQLSPALNADKVPDFRELDRLLLAATGWSIQVVPGLIPVDEFFELLAQKRFCSSTWLRKRNELDYLEEPDMFHDIFGHIPLLLHTQYAAFMQKTGALGVAYKNHPEIIQKLKSLYWYTIEFGLFQNAGQTKIYGAGIISSFGETNHIYTDPVQILPFEINQTMDTDFVNSEIQNLYYEIPSFASLFETLQELEPQLANHILTSEVV